MAESGNKAQAKSGTVPYRDDVRQSIESVAGDNIQLSAVLMKYEVGILEASRYLKLPVIVVRRFYLRNGLEHLAVKQSELASSIADWKERKGDEQFEAGKAEIDNYLPSGALSKRTEFDEPEEGSLENLAESLIANIGLSGEGATEAFASIFFERLRSHGLATGLEPERKTLSDVLNALANDPEAAAEYLPMIELIQEQGKAYQHAQELGMTIEEVSRERINEWITDNADSLWTRENKQKKVEALRFFAKETNSFFRFTTGSGDVIPVKMIVCNNGATSNKSIFRLNATGTNGELVGKSNYLPAIELHAK